LKTSAVIERLAAAVRHPSHEFWPDDRSLLDPDAVHAERVHGPRQITDLYLLALAVQRDGRLANFDGSVPLSAVPNATKKHLVAL
jgi:predicted nucleic acid-binding protein